ncbi:hypothetical protein PoB_005137900 [Plakobranchus ocellatus]|uniref:Uncharacterized protein n=1 Tax=Plakobranchus ocellatus TaxID=259542 RepID=A0AAV4BXD5_9GAST|nr:hypothetical protein PoB_005137900 [Plakobranchus ocellatus]
MKYTVKKKKSNKISYLPLDPQPPVGNILVLHRYYAKHSSGEQYEKRVSWLSGGSSIAIYEYKGVYPPLKPHSYIRMHPKEMQNAKSDTKFKKAGDIYLSGDSFEGPTNKRQIYNAKARAKHQGQEHAHKANFADEVAAVEELQHTMSFVRLIIRQSQKSPCIILYTEDQLNDVKRFCCPPLSGDSTVLGIDKTFNLVTITVYKCISVKRKRADDFPIFCGPIFLHGNSDRETFFLFLHHLSGNLGGCAQCPVLGSDEEKALRQAMSLAFPKYPRLACAQLLKKNLKHALADKVRYATTAETETRSADFLHLLVLLLYLTVT